MLADEERSVSLILGTAIYRYIQNRILIWYVFLTGAPLKSEQCKTAFVASSSETTKKSLTVKKKKSERISKK